MRPTLAFGNSLGSSRKKNLILNFGPDFKPNERENTNTDTDIKFKEIMSCTGNITIGGKVYKTDIQELEEMGILGQGTSGQVFRMKHLPSGQVIAVKQMRRSGNKDENKRIIMDLEVVIKSHDCPYIVQCLGCFITESDVWICMELMTTCMDKLLKNLKDQTIPETILGKVTVATVNALNYLKEKHGVIHRDVKPSNILLDEKGNVKLCDFGISGRLVDSKAKTRGAGCTAYMSPERIDPPNPNCPNYDIRADVWSLGLTLVELATGKFPYKDCSTDFEVMTRILNDEPPKLPAERNFSNEFHSFVKDCLEKDYRRRPKYKALLAHPFIKINAEKSVDIRKWYEVVCGRRIYPYTSSSSYPSSIGRHSGRMRSPAANGRLPSLGSPSPTARPSRYEEFSLPSPRQGLRTSFDRLNSEPLPSVRTPSTPGSPSPLHGTPPQPPPRSGYNRLGSDGHRTPTPTSSSGIGSSTGMLSSPSPTSLSMANSSSPSPSPQETTAPQSIRRLKTIFLCYTGC
jgi:mitogen-activated protein kinase kinase 7